MDKTERVKVWNTYFRAAREHAAELYPLLNNGKPPQKFDWKPAGETLEGREFHGLGMLTFCCLAIEARVNHMIDEKVKEKKISEKEGGKLKRNENFRQRWVGLANRVGVPLDMQKEPHKVIWELFEIRDAIFHMRFDELKEKLSYLSDYNYFTRFVNAMDDYNVKLRNEPSSADVLKIGRFD